MRVDSRYDLHSRDQRTGPRCAGLLCIQDERRPHLDRDKADHRQKRRGFNNAERYDFLRMASLVPETALAPSRYLLRRAAEIATMRLSHLALVAGIQVRS